MRADFGKSAEPSSYLRGKSHFSEQPIIQDRAKSTLQKRDNETSPECSKTSKPVKQKVSRKMEKLVQAKQQKFCVKV